jgi:hypothetical protein
VRDQARGGIGTAFYCRSLYGRVITPHVSEREYSLPRGDEIGAALRFCPTNKEDNDDQNNNPRRRARTPGGAVQSAAERVRAVTNAVWLSIFTLTWLIGLTFIFKF